MVTLERIVQITPFEKIAGQTVMGYVNEVKNFSELEKIVLDNALSGVIIGRKALSGLKNPGYLLKELAASYRRALGFSLIIAA